MRVLGIDHGERRIGLAVSDLLGVVAHQHDSVAVKGPDQAVTALRTVVEELGVEQIVVGLPLNMDGSEGPQAKAARAFAERLKKELGLPVEMQDERLTTAYVERLMISADMTRRRRSKRRDAAAAQRILQTYLDRQRASGGGGATERP